MNALGAIEASRPQRAVLQQPQIVAADCQLSPRALHGRSMTCPVIPEEQYAYDEPVILKHDTGFSKPPFTRTDLFAPRPKSRFRARQLMSTITIARIDSMAVQVDTSPGSPPELTDSRSSKSSSSHSSIFNGPGETDISHFEDITLDDVAEAPQNDSYHEWGTSQSNGTRLTSRSSASLKNRSNPKLPSETRNLTNVSKTRRPNTQGPPNGALRELPLHSSRNRSPRRGFTSPSTISLPAMASGSRSRSPTPSPTTKTSFSISPRLVPRSSLNIDHPTRINARRQSWQANRKTVKELEDEYHDSDEEVPEDAVIWNVPLSPRPVDQRSPSRSPERCSNRKRSSNSTRINSKLPPAQIASPQSAPVSAHSAGPEQGDLNLLRHRTKSWTSVLSDLSEDARTLTEALEDYAEKQEKGHGDNVNNGQKLEPLKRAVTTSAIELPPLRAGNIMIDPLPISKEKEKLLTRTRPSWLPPKDQKEEKKHLKEYQRMMAASLQAEKRKSAKAEEEQQQRDATRLSISRVWEQHVLPNWNEVMKESRTRELWWRGVAPRNRGVVWQKAVGNELGLSEAGYTAALKRAKEHDRRLSKMAPEDREKEHEFAWFEAIRRDVKTTYPQLKIFQEGGPLHEALLNVLMAYSMYRADVGYVYGCHLIAGLLLLNLDATSAFITLANLLNRRLPMAFLLQDRPAMDRLYQFTVEALQYKFPQLHNHLHNVLQLSPDEYIAPMFRTLFCNRLAIDTTSRMWDVYVFEEDRALIRGAVGTLAALESRLYGTKEEVLSVLGWEGPEWNVGNEDDFMKGVRDAGKVHVAHAKSPR